VNGETFPEEIVQMAKQAMAVEKHAKDAARFAGKHARDVFEESGDVFEVPINFRI
jgi:hypothetical protein